MRAGRFGERLPLGFAEAAPGVASLSTAAVRRPPRERTPHTAAGTDDTAGTSAPRHVQLGQQRAHRLLVRRASVGLELGQRGVRVIAR